MVNNCSKCGCRWGVCELEPATWGRNTGVNAGDVSDTLEESSKFVGKTVCPNVLVFVHLHQVSIFEDITCVVVDDGTNEMNGRVRGWGDCFQVEEGG